MKMIQMIREAVARLLPSGWAGLLPSGWADEMAIGMAAAFADQARGF